LTVSHVFLICQYRYICLLFYSFLNACTYICTNIYIYSCSCLYVNLRICHYLSYIASVYAKIKLFIPNSYYPIYTVSDPLVWVTINDSKQCEKIFFRPSLEEIYDLQWSPDSNFILAGAINSKAEIVRVLTKEKESLIIAGHTG
jgi:hypothetical protein